MYRDTAELIIKLVFAFGMLYFCVYMIIQANNVFKEAKQPPYKPLTE
jgi:hypothetical protein